MNSGLPCLHQRFWDEYSVEKLYSLYKSLTANHEEVIKIIREPDTMNGAEERAYGYLIKFVGSLKPEDLQGCLWFVTAQIIEGHVAPRDWKLQTSLIHPHPDHRL